MPSDSAVPAWWHGRLSLGRLRIYRLACAALLAGYFAREAMFAPALVGADGLIDQAVLRAALPMVGGSLFDGAPPSALVAAFLGCAALLATTSALGRFARLSALGCLLAAISLGRALTPVEGADDQLARWGALSLVLLPPVPFRAGALSDHARTRLCQSLPPIVVALHCTVLAIYLVLPTLKMHGEQPSVALVALLVPALYAMPSRFFRRGAAVTQVALHAWLAGHHGAVICHAIMASTVLLVWESTEREPSRGPAPRIDLYGVTAFAYLATMLLSAVGLQWPGIGGYWSARTLSSAGLLPTASALAAEPTAVDYALGEAAPRAVNDVVSLGSPTRVRWLLDFVGHATRAPGAGLGPLGESISMRLVTRLCADAPHGTHLQVHARTARDVPLLEGRCGIPPAPVHTRISELFAPVRRSSLMKELDPARRAEGKVELP